MYQAAKVCTIYVAGCIGRMVGPLSPNDSYVWGLVWSDILSQLSVRHISHRMNIDSVQCRAMVGGLVNEWAGCSPI